MEAITKGTMPSSQRNMQILQEKKRTFPHGIHDQKCKTAARNCRQSRQEMHLRRDDCAEFAVNTFTYEEDGSSDTEARTVILGSVSTENALHSLDSHQNRIYRSVRLNDQCNVKMKIDTGADTCILTADDLPILPISSDLQLSDSILKG